MQITKKISRLALITFILYMLLVFWVIALKCNMEITISDTKIMNRGLSLGERFKMYLSMRSFKSGTRDALVNMILFLPIGMLLPFFPKKLPYLKALFGCIGLTIGFEILQIIDCIGMFTYADLIYNTLGGAFGIALHFLLRRIVKERALEITLLSHIVFISLCDIGALINTLINIRIYF